MNFALLRHLCLILLCLPTGMASAQYYPNMTYGPKRVLAPGVTWQTATNASPTWSIHIIEIDMTNPNVELRPVFRASGNVLNGANERTSSMAARVDAIAAVNAGYRSTDGTNMTNSYTIIDGQFIGGSGTAMHPENNRSMLGFSGDHQAIAKRTKVSSAFVPADSTDWNKIIDGIAGRGHFVTSNGVLVTQDNEGTTSSHHGSRHPRTAIGFSTNPYRAWLVTVDGRQTGHSVGMTYLELGRLMADLGIEQSISLDGGGSTTAWIKGEGVVNSPSDGTERVVVSAWAVVPSTTVDNAVEGVTATGNWAKDVSHSERYYLDYLLTSNTAGPASVTWTPILARNGIYRVYAWWASAPNRTTAAPYRIDHGFGATTVTVNQTTNGGRWNMLGTFPFRAGSEGSVTLRNTGTGLVSADAIRFVFLRDEARLFWNPTDWKTIAFDDFDTTDPIAFDPLMRSSPDGTAGNSRWQRNFNYPSLAGPALPVPPKGNGVALRTSANNFLPAAEQLLFQTFGSADMEDSAVEALLLGYLANNNTAGATTWGGIGIRMSSNFRDGYFVQHRVDDSSTLGSYLNFYRIRNGDTKLLGRYYYRIGTSGVVQGSLGDSRAIRSPQQAATNQWIPVRLEAVGNTVVLFVENMETPVTYFVDPDPILSGKAALFHEDAFGGSLTTPADSSGTFFEYFQVDFPADPIPPAEPTPVIGGVEFLPGGGVRVQLSVKGGASYLVEASSDLTHWVTLTGTHTADGEGNLVIEDESAGEQRFWRFSRIE